MRAASWPAISPRYKSNTALTLKGGGKGDLFQKEKFSCILAVLKFFKLLVPVQENLLQFLQTEEEEKISVKRVK